MADIEIEIDGRKLAAKPNQTVIQVADEAGIYIPRFCYHQHLSIPANCRMCLVEVEKAPKALPACATPVTPGMKVFTQSQKTLKAQRAVMEFLLINHPLDCPICDQGGECELQDISMGYGSPQSKYTEAKRSVADQDLGPLVETEMTRCIYCTRCVRFGDEIAGMRELGAIGRGEFTEIGTYIQHTIQSEVSGNIIDLCPVGALTSKPFRYTARPWELEQSPSISPHDCIGSNLNIHTRYGTVMRAVSNENMAINEVWLSDRDRFSYTGLYHPDRLQQPMARINGQWDTVEWQTAFEIAAKGLQEAIAQHGADQFGALASPNATLEEFYLLQKIIRGLGSPHIDHRLRALDTRDDAATTIPGLGMSLDDFQQLESVLLIGSNLQKEQPIAGIRLRKASLKGTAVSVVNPIDYSFNFNVSAKKIVSPQAMVSALVGILKALDAKALQDVARAPDDDAKHIAQQLLGKTRSAVVLGALALHHREASVIRYLAQQIAALTGAKLCIMTDGANSAGGWLAGAVPQRLAGGKAAEQVGLNAYEMLKQPRRAYLLLNVEPEFDCANAHDALTALEQAQFTVALSMYRNPALEAHADVIFPMAAFTETSGTFVNVAGTWQSFKGAAKAFEASRPAWKILRVLGNFLHLEGFDYESGEAIKHEVQHLVEQTSVTTSTYPQPKLDVADIKLGRIGEVPLYAVDSLVRRAKPLQETQLRMLGQLNTVRLHPETAKKIGVKPGELVRVKQISAEAKLTVALDQRVAQDAAWIAGGIEATKHLGDLFGEVEISRG